MCFKTSSESVCAYVCVCWGRGMCVLSINQDPIRKQNLPQMVQRLRLQWMHCAQKCGQKHLDLSTRGKKPLPPYSGNWGSPPRSPLHGLGISAVVGSQLTFRWVAISHYKRQLHSDYTSSWGWSWPMTPWCRNTKAQPPFLNLGPLWKATPAPELPGASSEASLNCVSC